VETCACELQVWDRDMCLRMEASPRAYAENFRQGEQLYGTCMHPRSALRMLEMRALQEARGDAQAAAAEAAACARDAASLAELLEQQERMLCEGIPARPPPQQHGVTPESSDDDDGNDEEDSDSGSEDECDGGDRECDRGDRRRDAHQPLPNTLPNSAPHAGRDSAPGRSSVWEDAAAGRIGGSGHRRA
jgi:hypothetical protein